MAFTAAELRACAERELNMRKRVYQNRILTGRMSEQKATRETQLMQAIVDHFREQEQRERIL